MEISMNKSEKCSTTQRNRIVINNGECEKRVYRDELDSYLMDGWVLGTTDAHKKKCSDSKKGQVPYNKGRSVSEVTRKKISESLIGNTPWNKGKVGVQVAWNKGLCAETDVRVHKISTSKLGHEVSQEAREKMRNSHAGKKLSSEKLAIKLTKEYLTKKKNNSFNTSCVEQNLYEQLLEENKHKTIYRQYKDERYPFYCDFYIVEDDLFIELNAHWTHGGMPFDENDPKCIEQLNSWKEKAKTSQFYAQAIETWTVRDVAKRKYAEENKLNIKFIY